MSRQNNLHNELAGPIVASIVKPPLEAGGDFTDVLILLESVILGVVMMAVKLGGDEKVLDVVIEGARERLAEARLKDVQASGSA